MEIYPEAEQFMVDACTVAKNETDISYHRRTVHWVKFLKPDASEALLVAAILHDIEREMNGDWKAGSSDPIALQKHEELSALEAEMFLQKEKADEKFIEKVKDLILHHETGGTEEQNILCDADAAAWLEEKALRNVKASKKKGKTKEEMKEKLMDVFGRITSDAAKRMARPWLDDALTELEKIN